MPLEETTKDFWTLEMPSKAIYSFEDLRSSVGDHRDHDTSDNSDIEGNAGVL